MQSNSFLLCVLFCFVMAIAMVTASVGPEQTVLAATEVPHRFLGKEWEDYFAMSHLIASQFGASNGAKAVDVSELLSPSHWACFAKTAKIAIPRGYRSIGAVDTNLADNVRHLQESGYDVASTHAYMFPCIKNCPSKSVEVQFNELWSYMTNEKLKIDFLWLDIEEAKYWYADKFTNQLKLEQLISAAKAKNAAFGIYTSKNNWSEIFGLDYTLAHVPPLWYAHYNNLEDCADFSPFGGFTKPLMHQYYGSHTDPCGVDHDMSIYC